MVKVKIRLRSVRLHRPFGSYTMLEGNSIRDTLSVAELAIEVQRLKILIGSYGQAQEATGLQQTALLNDAL